MHADANGVTSIPLEIAADVPQAAAESIVLDYLRSGKPSVKGFTEARQAMMSEIAALGKRVRGKDRLPVSRVAAL